MSHSGDSGWLSVCSCGTSEFNKTGEFASSYPPCQQLGRKAVCQHAPSLGLLLPSPASVQMPSAACLSSGAGLCHSSALLLAPLQPVLPTDMGSRHCCFIRNSFKCFKPLLRSKQPARCSTRNGNLKMVVKSGSQYFFLRRVGNLGVMRIHTDGFPQTLLSSSQKSCSNKF